jgi:hypothetical protein
MSSDPSDRSSGSGVRRSSSLRSISDEFDNGDLIPMSRRQMQRLNTDRSEKSSTQSSKKSEAPSKTPALVEDMISTFNPNDSGMDMIFKSAAKAIDKSDSPALVLGMIVALIVLFLVIMLYKRN